MAKNIHPIEIIKPYLRNGSFPLDPTTLFTSYDDAVDYAHNNPSAYATQIIGIDDQENRKTSLYKLDYDPNKRYRLVLTEIGIGNSTGSTMFNLKGSVDVTSKDLYPAQPGDNNVITGQTKTKDTEVVPGKVYYEYSNELIENPNPELLSSYYEMSYIKTSDASAVEGKVYYEFDAVSLTYKIVENPIPDSLKTDLHDAYYYEGILVKADTSNITYEPTKDTQYVKTVDTEINSNKQYYEKIDNGWKPVESPIIDNLSSYYELFTLDKTKKYYTKSGRQITNPILSELDQYYEKAFIEDKKYYYLTYEPVVNPKTEDLGNYYEDGLIDNRTELPDLASQGDMYLVRNENTFYIAFENPDESVSWSPLSLHIEYASLTNDGIVSKELYSSFQNKTGKDALWIAKNNTPENNNWVEISHTESESSREYKIVSEGRVKQMVTTLFGEATPYITITSEDPTECAVGDIIMPTLTVAYHQEFGGAFDHIAVYRIINGVSEDSPIYSTTPDSNMLFPVDGLDNTYTFTFSTLCESSLSAKGTIAFKVVVDYLADDTGDVPAGSCESTIIFHFYDQATYGTNIKTNTALINNNPIKLSYDPRSETEGINELFLTIPKNYYVTKIIYTAQNDLYAKDLFTTSLDAENNTITYSYKLGYNLTFKTPAEYVFYIAES